MPYPAPHRTTPEDESGDTLWPWLRNQAWPTWLAYGVDWTRGGFHEWLDPALRCDAPDRRLRVAARQVFSFAAAATAGLPRAAQAVELGVDILRRRARQADGGYASRLALDNAAIEGPRDLYDHAFVLLALSVAAAVLPADPLRRDALALLAHLDRHFAHPAGGYAESRPAALPRRQNPHMHLLEACLAAWETFQEPIFLDRANALLHLFLARFLDPATGTLPEYFDEALRPLPEAGRHAVEPGHHCEWAWLLHRHRDAAGPTAGTAEAARGLLAFVDRHGVNPATGTLRDGLWSDGTVREAGSRLWPQTERLKSEALRPDSTPEGRARAAAALRRHLSGATPGLWFERLDAEGHPRPGPAPASSLYHLTAGIPVPILDGRAREGAALPGTLPPGA